MKTRSGWNPVRRALLFLAVALLAGGGALQTAGAQSLLDKLGAGNEDEFLPAEQAFVLSISRLSANHFTAHWQITPGYYLYRDKIKVAIDGEAVHISKPPGRVISDPYFGETSIYRDQTVIAFEAEPAKSAHVTWQGCADAGLCYPPVTQVLALAEAPASDGQNQPEHVQLADYLGEAKLLVATLAFFGLGLLLAFTPCVLPMIPILSTIITSSPAGRSSPAAAFKLSLAYVLAMAVTYSIAGVAIALSGSGFQLWFQHPVVISSFAAVFIVLAFAMFGFYDLQLPASVNTRLARISQNRSGSLPGAAIMGVLSALIVSPCVTPPLIGALLFVARSGDVATGGVALFSLALGMGVPLLAVGTSLGRFIPKASAALDFTKAVAGFIMVGFAIWLLDRIATAPTTALLSGLLISAVGIHLLRALKDWRRFRPPARIAGIIALAYGALLSLHAINGGSNWTQPWRIADVPKAQSQVHTSRFPRATRLAEIQNAIGENRDSGTPLMLVFYADWCVSCKELEALTFSDGEVQKMLARVNALEADVTKPDEHSRLLLSHFGLFGPPAILFFNPSGAEIKSARLVGFVSAADFAAHLRQVFALQA